jgi:hypothetical protein
VSAPACARAGCTAVGPHEHRRQTYSIYTDTLWWEVTQQEIEVIQAWREAQGLPWLVFTVVAPQTQEARTP